MSRSPAKPPLLLRRWVILSALASGLVGGAFGYNLADLRGERRDQDLASAYQRQLNTVRELMTYARARAVSARPGGLDQAVARAAEQQNAQQFESAQAIVGSLARDLIATMDGELGPDDQRFIGLLRRFEAGERTLEQIRRRPRARLFRLSRARDERL